MTMTIVKEPNPPFPVEIIDVVPTEVANPFTKQKVTLQPTAIAVYDCIKGAEMVEEFDIQDFEEHTEGSFADFVNDLTEDKANENAVCGIDDDDCEACGA